ncbi:MAG: hypothetical protein GEU99_00920 [Luteitalea sp.]|nr:hypothetical protein [Luteitalea sp.]
MGGSLLSLVGWWATIGAMTTALVAPAVPARAQTSAARRAAIVESLLAYPVFYSGQAVRVRGVLETSRAGVELVARGGRILLLGAEGGSAAGPNRPVEVSGTFLDIGRFRPGDPRLQRFDVAAVARQRFNRDWPGAGELLALVVDALEPAQPFPAPSVRALALSPEHYVDRSVTVVGRFRGRNLYGDLPKAPGVSRWDFVLQLADAAVWVVGRRPRGDGFDLDPELRVDTGRWLEIQGRVDVDRGLVWIEAASIDLADPPVEAPLTRSAAPIPEPPLDVTFSVPTEGEEDAVRSAPVRIQFSRDMESSSFKGRVRVRYQEGAPTGSSESESTDVTLSPSLSYDAGRRVLEIRLAEPLPPFTKVRVTLEKGITSTTGQALEPWTLAFTTGQ